MTAFLLVKSTKVNRQTIDNAREKFKKKSFELKEQFFLLGEYELYYYHDLFGETQKIYKSSNGDIFFLIGTLVIENKLGAEALKIVEKRLDQGRKIENMAFSGSFILIIYRKGELLITRDLFGGVDCYVNPYKDWMTTNFLSAIALNKNNKFSKYELWEFILFGFVFGYRTIVEGICLLETTAIFHLSNNNSINKKINFPPIETNFAKCLQNNLDILIQEFEAYAKAMNGNVVSALSGGYDTRLMLALMLEVQIEPNLYVYGTNSEKNVKVAKNIAETEGFYLRHINKRDYPKITKNQFRRVAENNYYDLDLRSNIFADQADLDTRKIRARNGDLVLNGSGGEIYRDVWKWDFKKENLYDIFRNSYDIGRLEEINVNPIEFFQNIEGKMRKKISLFFDIDEEISRQQAEMIFPIYRSKFYSPSNTLNNYFGNATFPFMSEPVLLHSFSIPHQFKRHGDFERLLIKKLNPKLASYMSDYGYDFTHGPGFFKKIIEKFYSALSPEFKAKLKSITPLSKKSLFSPSNNKNPYFEREYLEQLIDPANMRIGDTIGDIRAIKNQNVLNRIYNLEYLVQKADFH